MRHGNFLKNAAIVSVGVFIAKGIGAFYRVYLSNLLGGYGVGLYQMAYPLFCVLLTFSSAGIPNALSRVIARERAEGKDARPTLKAAIKCFALLGLAGSFTMCLCAVFFSRLQGDEGLTLCYYALAPSVFLVSVIAVLRGYFQGCKNMTPTAASQIVEQLFKAALGGLFALYFAGEPVKAAAAALLAVSLSEGVALAYLVLIYRKQQFILLPVKRPSGARVLRTAIPVMAATSLLPLSQTVDSVLIVRFLSRYTDRAVTLYGLYAGSACSLVNLPATVCYGFATAAVPSVSEAFARGEIKEGKKRAVFALLLTVALSAPCAVGLFVFAEPIVSLLYSSLPAIDKGTLISLLRLCSVSAVLEAGTQTLAACLTGMGRAKLAAFSMLVAVMVKLSLQCLFLPNPAYSIDGAAIAGNVCYLVAFSLNLVYTLRERKTEGERKGYDLSRRIGSRKRGLERTG